MLIIDVLSSSHGVPHKMDGRCGLRYANGAFAPACSRTQHFVSLFACYVHCARFPQMLRACVSLCLWSQKSRFLAYKKNKHRIICAYFFLWCGHRDLNSDGVTIRPSNVRVCLFRHDRLTLPII